MGTRDLETADFMAAAPRCAAETVVKAPLKAPQGVREALMM